MAFDHSEKMDMSQIHLEKKISAELVKFADCLAPSDSFNSTGKKLVQAVFEHLKRRLKLRGIPVSHTYIGGSFGKNTSVIFPDFDCVLFLNKTNPPLTRQIDHIREILEESSDILKIDASSISITEMTVKLTFKNGVEMDLLPACNYDQHNPEEQYRQVLLRIHDPGFAQAKYFSSSLAPMQIEFLRDQSGPTHQLIRIAKYCYKSSYFWSYGGCTIIEILCVCTAIDLGNCYSLLTALKHFFSKYICNLDTLKIAFYRQNGSWTRIFPEMMPYFENHFDPEITSRSTYIIEPANPYNDLAQNLTDNLQEMKAFGGEMLKRLEALESPKSNGFKRIILSRDVEISYLNLFLPFKLNLKRFYNSSGLPSQAYVQYQLNIKYNWGTDHVKVWKPTYFKENREAQWVYENILTNLLFLLRGKARQTNGKPLTFVDGLPVMDTLEDVKSAVKIFNDANSGGFKSIKETGFWYHERSFVTLTIPYWINDEKCAVRYSLVWPETGNIECVML